MTAQRGFIHDLKNVRVLRYPDVAVAKDAGSCALPYLGQHYSIRKAVQSILPNTKLAKVDDDKLFCSALVAAAYRKAGAKELEHIDPMRVTPATLEKANYFSDVTAEVFVRVLSPNNIEEMSALDGDRQPSPLDKQAELFQEFSGILLPKIREFIKTTPEVTFKLVPTTFLECVPFIEATRRICEEMPASKEARNKISEIDDVAYALLADGRFEKMQADATAQDAGSIQYTIEQSFKPRPDIDPRETRALIGATRQQIASRSARPQREETSRVGIKWREISDEIVNEQKRRLVGLEESFQRAFPGEHL
ncbi:MAG: hypothetical protein P4M13_00045 [Alphaproteobacteria bacterium]|nr:hypothetical protein [Alphaproteobacteria bacterium]